MVEYIYSFFTFSYLLVARGLNRSSCQVSHDSPFDKHVLRDRKLAESSLRLWIWPRQLAFIWLPIFVLPTLLLHSHDKEQLLHEALLFFSHSLLLHHFRNKIVSWAFKIVVWDTKWSPYSSMKLLMAAVL